MTQLNGDDRSFFLNMVQNLKRILQLGNDFGSSAPIEIDAGVLAFARNDATVSRQDPVYLYDVSENRTRILNIRNAEHVVGLPGGHLAVRMGDEQEHHFWSLYDLAGACLEGRWDGPGHLVGVCAEPSLRVSYDPAREYATLRHESRCHLLRMKELQATPYR